MATMEARKPRAGGIALRWISRAGPSASDRGARVSPIPCTISRGEQRQSRRRRTRRRVKLDRPHQQLAEGRAEGEAEVEAEGVVAERLAHPARRREVGERGEGRDEEGGLRDAEHQAEGDDRGRVSTNAVSSMATAHSSAPPRSSGRRPQVSESRPANGRRTRAETANAPKASPAPAVSEPTGPVTYSGSA